MTVLHYTGYDDDRGGIVSVVRALAAARQFDCVLGLNAGGRQLRTPPLPVREFPRLAGEKIGLLNLWRARRVAVDVQAWLREDVNRVFHGHSRAGLLVGFWLQRLGERRVVVSVHCYGRQRWFYRSAARRLGDRLYWLTPAMKRYYGIAGADWAQCIPGGVPASQVARATPVVGAVRLGGIGAVVPWKRWDLVLDALALLPPETRSKVAFRHIGDGPAEYLASLRHRVAAHGLGGQVVFSGPEPTADKLLGEIDALVIASRDEPCSMAMLEALAAGVPVIAADTGGAGDFIRPEVNGRPYRTGDASGLARCLEGWLAKPPAFDVEKIRQSASRADDIAARWCTVYEKLQLR
jgi:glycosyltransferase involved in cell wall biosynthesis